MPNFSVDTHLFRELGELLVGRDSTALVELVKNAYDADATSVIVHGEMLDTPALGKIIITDNGNGMSPEEFKRGFLRVASRMKDGGDRRSAVFGRRFTGAKGVGRLAAHKLACYIKVESVPRSKSEKSVIATIDWDKVERCETLDQVEESKAITLVSSARGHDAKHGTIITLSRLRRKWTPGERTRFFQEMSAFRPPELLLKAPKALVGTETLLGDVEPCDVETSGEKVGATTFQHELTGEFDAGENYLQAVAETADWVVEINAQKGKKVNFAIYPTKRVRVELGEEGASARKREAAKEHPNPENGPFFVARIFVREGSTGLNKQAREWVGRESGVRVFVEGFRVLPYGEPSDDWLSIDRAYVKRGRALEFLGGLVGVQAGDEDEGLSHLRKEAYFGAVFLTQSGAGNLQMLVNREGFVPTQEFTDLTDIVKTGIDLSVRVRAAARSPLREQRSRDRSEKKKPVRLELKAAVEEAVAKASAIAQEARACAARGDYQRASELIVEAAGQFEHGSETSERLLTERETVHVLASLGLHMSAFVHEVRGLLGLAQVIERQLDHLRTESTLPAPSRQKLAELAASIGELRRVVERQSANLTDVTSPDARRRRSKQKLAERFSSAMRLLAPQAERHQIKIDNRLPAELKSPPIFPAELMLIFANILSNAIKAAGAGGRIVASGTLNSDGAAVFRLENTGVKVDLQDAERWFRPFETTTAHLEPALGQGMGMGLTITRNLLEEYGAEIRFTRPSSGFATAVEIQFPS
jgi:signal transduction histidine kinase